MNCILRIGLFLKCFQPVQEFSIFRFIYFKDPVRVLHFTQVYHTVFPLDQKVNLCPWF